MPANTAKEKEAPKKESTKNEPKEAVSEAWIKVQLARHPQRPHALDFINALSTEFVELHGDRAFGDDGALVGGVAKFEGQAVMVIGNQKGRDTKENIVRNWGSARPEGYRKSRRLLEQAEKFGMPVLSFIDTSGAFPGKEGEERGIAQSIADNLLVLSRLRVPILTLVTGEGGSGGALAIGLGDRMLMLENAIYSVASPEGSAAILWRDAVHAPAAAEAMKITAQDLYGFGIIDEIIPEPSGGAHTDPPTLFAEVRAVLARHLQTLQRDFIERGESGIQAMLEARYQKYRQIGRWSELTYS